MSDESSITCILRDLEAGENVSLAQKEILDRYFKRLAGLAKSRLGESPTRAADEEDVALDVLQTFFAGISEGKYPDLADRSNLWSLLATITVRMAVNHHNKYTAQKRGGGRVKGESVFEGPDGDQGMDAVVAAENLAPESMEQIITECQSLFDELPDDNLKIVAQRRLEGYSIEEIAAELGCVKRTVDRKLDRIRHIWNDRVPDE